MQCIDINQCLSLQVWVQQITRMWMHCFKHAGRTLRSSSALVTASMLFEQTRHLAAENRMLRQSRERLETSWQQHAIPESTKAEAATCYEVQIYTGDVQVSPAHESTLPTHTTTCRS